ncbi:hypothetical protein ACFVUW_09065 [Streptomyces xiamenensis]|jgi:hypothetical protein|uniref:hypothetical protein n=1 Tax=Streptomyces xiamenensis TaxID=408015 RepID=UPI0036EE4E60
MHDSLRKMIGLAGVLLGVGLAFWLFFGAPNGWSGDMRYVRFALGLGAYALIHAGVVLSYPDELKPGHSAADREEKGRTA